MIALRLNILTTLRIENQKKPENKKAIGRPLFRHLSLQFLSNFPTLQLTTA